MRRRELARLIEHEGEAAAHARAEVLARPAEHDHQSFGHVLAAMIANTLNDRRRAGVAHREALARDAIEVRLAASRTVQHDVSNENVLFGHERRLARRIYDDPSAR